jgi:DNA-binding transcriptional ArsR family regulator
METWSRVATEAPADLLRAFADPIRRQLIERLVAGPSSAGDLARRLALPRVNVSHHLGVLAAAGLVDLRQRQAAVRPEALHRLRCYFDAALTTAAITLPGLARPVARATQI